MNSHLRKILQNGPNIEIEAMRTLVLEGLRYFSLQSDHTSNYPDLKTIPNLKQHWMDSRRLHRR
jgi:hypothetical protein